MNDKFLSLLSLAQKAGKMQSGEYQVENAVKSMQASCVVVAGDASDNTKKKFGDMCSFYEVPYMEYADKETLGHAIGKEYRAVLALCDEGFAKSLGKAQSE